MTNIKQLNEALYKEKITCFKLRELASQDGVSNEKANALRKKEEERYKKLEFSINLVKAIKNVNKKGD